MNGRREVRVAPIFFEQLDRQLGTERGPNGEPSATDFLVMDLPGIVEKFATAFDNLPMIAEGVPSARRYIGTGLLVTAVVVHGVELTDGAIELVGITIDL